MGQLGRAATADDNFVTLHGRRFAMLGDGQAGDPSGLVLDGKCIASNREPRVKITAVAVGHNGAGAITVAGAVIGDTVMAVVNLTTPALSSSSFETTVTVAGQVQQTSASDLSGSTFMFEVFPRS